MSRGHSFACGVTVDNVAASSVAPGHSMIEDVGGMQVMVNEKCHLPRQVETRDVIST